MPCTRSRGVSRRPGPRRSIHSQSSATATRPPRWTRRPTKARLHRLTPAIIATFAVRLRRPCRTAQRSLLTLRRPRNRQFRHPSIIPGTMQLSASPVLREVPPVLPDAVAAFSATCLLRHRDTGVFSCSRTHGPWPCSLSQWRRLLRARTRSLAIVSSQRRSPSTTPA